jgi:hypothetical protein
MRAIIAAVWLPVTAKHSNRRFATDSCGTCTVFCNDSIFANIHQSQFALAH